ncbi:hypothetical protein Poli38472_008806 [Pythium oligandrum]|uniref:Uncharacterized protein n=1 Tax=Pythium oligandrum TaxID=41045 RepID=A0A8K1FET7_PYTOL|nr:hypothetical protein Poli38472_008806 [Pythium oligandrum]|eukprot:TMW56158.1 hypothetical protein Poli38472_008806 [Pythium oligandrum]
MAGRCGRMRRPLARLWLLGGVAVLLSVSVGLPQATAVRMPRFPSKKEKRTQEVEIKVQDYSFSAGPKDKIAIRIESKDIKASEIHAMMADSRESAVEEKKPKAAAPRTSTPKHTMPSVIPENRSPSKTIQQSSLWPYDLREELSHAELMMILVAIICSVCLLGLVLTATWSLARFTWQSIRERRLLSRLFQPNATAESLARAIKTTGTAMPLLMKPLANAHLRHVQFMELAQTLVASTATLRFDETELVLHGLPKGEDGQSLTLYHLFSTLEPTQCLGESVVLELGSVTVLSHWTSHVKVVEWQKDVKTALNALKRRRLELQELQQRIVETLEARHVNGEPIAKTKLMSLVAALRQGPTPDSSASPKSVSKSVKDGKDEFGFFLRSFEELREQQSMQDGLVKTLTTIQVTKETRLLETDAKTTHVRQATEVHVQQSVPSSTEPSHTAQLDSHTTRQLESFVDKAEEMEMTHLDEVKQAQYLLEDAKRESFCMLHSSRDAMQSVDALRSNLVALGADPKAAVLTAADIYANHTNMMMLTRTLRSVFDEFRKGDMIKMEERRKRHALKDREKRERIMQKFRLKQQLMVEKMDLQRQLEQEHQERERLRREQEELEVFVRESKAERHRFVWQITKLNVLIVLLVMGVVFFESLTQLELFKPVCSVDNDPKEASMFTSLVKNWWPTNALSLLQCRASYALKITAIVVVSILAFYVVAQLNLLTVALPGALGMGLYYIRMEWMNMIFRLPFLLVVYGFNLMALYVMNRLPNPRSNTKRRALLFYGAFPIASIVLSVVVSITIACDNPHECVTTATSITQRSLSTLWSVARQAYHLD